MATILVVPRRNDSWIVAAASRSYYRDLLDAGEFIEVAVMDDGPGVAPDDLPRVFDPFFTTKPPGKGTGLGLTIARNIVLQYGGAIDLSSQPGRGTTVAVRLPTCPAASGSLQ